MFSYLSHIEYCIQISMNAHQIMALAHVIRPAPTRLGHSIVDAHLVMLCKVMVTIAAVSEYELCMADTKTVNIIILLKLPYMYVRHWWVQHKLWIRIVWADVYQWTWLISLWLPWRICANRSSSQFPRWILYTYFWMGKRNLHSGDHMCMQLFTFWLFQQMDGVTTHMQPIFASHVLARMKEHAM